MALRRRYPNLFDHSHQHVNQAPPIGHVANETISDDDEQVGKVPRPASTPTSPKMKSTFRPPTANAASGDDDGELSDLANELEEVLGGNKGQQALSPHLGPTDPK